MPHLRCKGKVSFLPKFYLYENYIPYKIGIKTGLRVAPLAIIQHTHFVI